MKIEEFQASLKDKKPPEGMPPLLAAMWWDGNGDWAQAHELAQAVESRDGAWVHAYLHRKDGDTENAGYWYGQAGKALPQVSSEAEWDEIVTELLDSRSK
jgi:hypothetical protein